MNPQDLFKTPDILQKYNIRVSKEDNTKELERILKHSSILIEAVGINIVLNHIFLEALLKNNENIVTILVKDNRIERSDDIVTLLCQKTTINIFVILWSAGGFNFNYTHLETCFRLRNIQHTNFLLACGIAPSPEMLKEACLIKKLEEREEFMSKIIQYSSLVKEFDYMISAIECLKCYLTLDRYLQLLKINSITLNSECIELMLLECLEQLAPHILTILVKTHSFPVTYKVLVKISDMVDGTISDAMTEDEIKRKSKCLDLVYSNITDVSIIEACIENDRIKDAEKLISLNKIQDQNDKNKLLIRAVKKNNKVLVVLLLDHDAIPIDNKALIIACQKGYNACFRALLNNRYYNKYIGSTKCTGQNDLIEVCMKNPTAFIVKAFLKRPIFKLPVYAIFLSACCKKKTKVVSMLIDKTDINQQRIGLLNAIEVGSRRCVEIILRYSNWRVVNPKVKLYAQEKKANFLIINLLNLESDRRKSVG